MGQTDPTPYEGILVKYLGIRLRCISEASTSQEDGFSSPTALVPFVSRAWQETDSSLDQEANCVRDDWMLEQMRVRAEVLGSDINGSGLK